MFASIPYGIYLQKMGCIPTQQAYITLNIIFIWMSRFQNILPTLISFVLFLQRLVTNQYYRNPARSLFHMDTRKHACIWYDFSANLRWLWTNLFAEIDCVYVLSTSDSKVYQIKSSYFEGKVYQIKSTGHDWWYWGCFKQFYHWYADITFLEVFYY